MWDLSFPTRDGTHILCCKADLNHWNTREVSRCPFELLLRHLANSYIPDLVFPPVALPWQPGLGQTPCVGVLSQPFFCPAELRAQHRGRCILFCSYCPLPTEYLVLSNWRMSQVIEWKDYIVKYVYLSSAVLKYYLYQSALLTVDLHLIKSTSVCIHASITTVQITNLSITARVASHPL